MDVTLAASVDEFFHEVVTDALAAVDLEASEPASWYLVGLLGDFTRARLTDEPLGMKLAQPSLDAGERVRTLKQVGDTSLYVAGFFAESLTRSLVGVDYYVGLGQSAYAQLAKSVRLRTCAITSTNCGKFSASSSYTSVKVFWPPSERASWA